VKKIKLPARIESLGKLMEFVSRFAEAAGFSPEKIQKIDLAMEEALVNIFRYAYEENRGGEVEVRCRMENGNALIIDILDCGVPFDIRTAPVPDIRSGISERKVGGLGILLIKKVVDEVRYRQEGKCNILTFVQRRKN
jgi:anti-sigma regulatory factor (Ser/Thr protein kinase)